MKEYLYQIMFYNGKAIRFYANEVMEVQTKYVFVHEGETVEEFNKQNIAGWLILGVNEDE